eukprot:g4833.t1
MDLFFLQAPEAFLYASAIIKGISIASKSVLTDMIDVALADERANCDNFASRLAIFKVQNVPSDTSAVASAMSGLCLIFRGAKKENCSADELVHALTKYTDVGDVAAKLCGAEWRSFQARRKAEGKASTLKEMFTIGKLESINWKVGVAYVSSTCEKLRNPYVALQFKVHDHFSGKDGFSTRTVELTVPEFHAMHSTLREVLSRME